jgi:hypothetical protein
MRKHFRHYLLLVLLLAAFVVRLFHFSSPLADWHSWRQADTSAVTRNFFKQGVDLLHPRFDDLSNVPSGKDNPQGYRFVEFPLYNLMQAGVYSLSGGLLNLEEAGRLVSILATLSIVAILYLLVKKYLNETAALLTAAIYAFLPYTIYYGRTILPDTTMAAAILAGIYFFDRWAETVTGNKGQGTKNKNYLYFFLAFFFTSCAFLLKPYALLFTLPMLVIAWNAWGFAAIRQWQLWVFAIMSVIPLVLWRLWMQQYPEGIPASAWLLNGNGIRFRPAFFRWIGYERITSLISGYAAVILLVLGFYSLRLTKQWLFFLSFLVSAVLYVVIFATGNVQHDYYQILIMPALAIYMGLGAYTLLRLTTQWGKYTGSVLLLLIAAISFYFSWKQVRDYFNINNPRIVTVGTLVDRTVPKEAKVIALYQGDTTFLYQTNRQGWASFEHALPEMVSLGADYLVQLDPTPDDITRYLTDYDIVASSSGYVLVKLH